MIYLEDGKVVPVDKSELPIELPNEIDLNRVYECSKIANLHDFISRNLNYL